jgi:hypothetical protein
MKIGTKSSGNVAIHGALYFGEVCKEGEKDEYQR